MDDNSKKIIFELIGKKLKRVCIANSMMDACFQFDNNFILKTFTCNNALSQWKVFSKDSLVFNAKIERYKN